MIVVPTKPNLLNFLTHARKSAHNNRDQELATINIPRARVFTKKSGEYLYTRTTWGDGAFMQNEIIFYGNNMIWSMSLQGRTITTSATQPSQTSKQEFKSSILAFVDHSRSQTNHYRFSPGPHKYSDSNFHYTCETTGGDYSWLRGQERVHTYIHDEDFTLFISLFQAQILVSP